MSGSGRARLAAGLIAACALLAPAPAMAHDDLLFSDGGKLPGFDERHLHQRGGDAGHLPATRAGVDVVSRLALKNVVPGKIADVGVAPDGNTAYLAAWGVETCKYNGVHVVDISDPGKPRETGFIVSKEGSYPGEGMHAIAQTTAAFKGTLLVTNNEKCKGQAGFGGLNLYDVTNPRNPTPLAVGIGDFGLTSGQGKKDAHEIHSVFAWDAGARAYAAIVDNEEGADLDIMDITDPRKPFLTAEYDLDERFPQIRQDSEIPNLVEIFLHDMVVKEVDGRQIMSASYWDAGHVKLDVTDVDDVRYLGDTDMAEIDPEAAESGLTVPPEGNAHQSEFTADDRHLIGSDEDFGPYAIRARNETDATDLTASQGSDTPLLAEGQRISGQARFGGRACPGDPAVPAGNGAQIAVVERGICAFTEKVAAVEAAGGYKAILVFNRQGTDACNETLGMSVAGGLTTFGVAPREQGYAIFGQAYDDAACRAGSPEAVSPIALGATGDVLTFESYFDGWGYVRLFANGSGKLAELDTYAIREAHDPRYADTFGDLSVHEVATSPTDPTLAYYSYYSGGFRVTRIEDGRLVEKGRFIAEGGSNLWGVDVFRDGGTEYVAASDRDEGLYIFRYTGG